MQTQCDLSLMRAVRLDGPGLTARVERLAAPRPRAGEVLLRVLAAGVCHTELQLLDGTLDPGVWPLTPGHEIVGEVIEGPAELIGQRALVYYSRPCGECEWCAQGNEQVCPNAGPQPGLSTDGGFAERVCVPADSLVCLPEGLQAHEAAPLGCAAATAYHALHAVACVQPGETMAIFGVGGVGLALIQLGVLRGARVLAVGRSAAKLALAQELGAETVDASIHDPVLGVRRLTGGQGAHAVFELVASEESLSGALAMVRRRGRLVLVGYGSARLRLNPLELILRETQLVSSLGNTRAELREVVRLAASGALRVPIAGEYALEDVAGVLEALRDGRLVGRAVVVPSARPKLLGGTPATPRASLPAATLERQASSGARRVTGEAHVTLQGATHGRPLEAELVEFVSRGVDGPRDDAEFNELALRLFAYQFANNRSYRLLAERRGRTPATLSHWRDLPAVPIAAFKETLLAAEPIDSAVEFNSSGTTRPERKSRHFHPDLSLYNLNAQLNFKAHVLPERDRLRLLVLFPRRDELPNSSLAHWLTLMVERFGGSGSDWFVSNTGGLDAPGLLSQLQQAREPVGVLAASFGLVHFLEYCQEQRARVALPPASRVMDTGGYKGRSREYARDELYAMVTHLLGVPASHIVNMYGMTEHGTQFLDAVLRDHLAGRPQPLVRHKVVPPWARTLVVDPATMVEQPAGERGLLLHVDLINRASALCVLTEDVGHTVGDGFELLGRARGSEARGCSIALDELIQAVQAGA